MDTSTPGIVKVTVNLPQETVDILKRIAERRRITMTQALRQAIATEEFVENTINKGGKILVKEQPGPNAPIHEVIFKL